MILEIIRKTYRIIRNRGDTVSRSKTVLQQTKEFKDRSIQMVHEIKEDGLHIDDFKKLQQGGNELLTKAENIANEIGDIGEKIKDPLQQTIKKSSPHLGT